MKKYSTKLSIWVLAITIACSGCATQKAMVSKVLDLKYDLTVAEVKAQMGNPDEENHFGPITRLFYKHKGIFEKEETYVI